MLQGNSTRFTDMIANLASDAKGRGETELESLLRFIQIELQRIGGAGAGASTAGGAGTGDGHEGKMPSHQLRVCSDGRGGKMPEGTHDSQSIMVGLVCPGDSIQFHRPGKSHLPLPGGKAEQVAARERWILDIKQCSLTGFGGLFHAVDHPFLLPWGKQAPGKFHLGFNHRAEFPPGAIRAAIQADEYCLQPKASEGGISTRPHADQAVGQEYTRHLRGGGKVRACIMSADQFNLAIFNPGQAVHQGWKEIAGMEGTRWAGRQACQAVDAFLHYQPGWFSRVDCPDRAGATAGIAFGKPFTGVQTPFVFEYNRAAVYSRKAFCS